MSRVSEAQSSLPVLSAFQHEFMPHKDVWQAPAHLKLDQTRLKYSAMFSRFYGAGTYQRSAIASQQEPIAMWIADMDVPPCDEIISAVTKNLCSTYGYQSLDIGEAVAKRFERSAPKYSRFEIKSSDVVDVASVIGAIDVALRTFCKSGQKVMVLTPTYSPITETVKNNDLEPVYIPIEQPHCTDEEKYSEVASLHTGKYEGINDSSIDIDLNALDKSAAAFVICHPNNPTGTVLCAKAQREIVDFCTDHNILLITDEVHSEFAFNSHNEPTLIPIFGSEIDNDGLNKIEIKQQEKPEGKSNGITPQIIHVNSASKAFNLASIPGASYAIIKDKKTRERFAQAINERHLSASNLGKVALIAAYENGSSWLDTVKSALSFNRKLVVRFFKHYGINARYTMGGAGYFLWLDLASFPLSISQPIVSDIAEKKSLGNEPDQVLRYSPVTSVEQCIARGVVGNDGASFGSTNYIRLNLACHPAVIEAALLRLCFIS
tara:strand:+ start:1353 stop:2825 length:1473 start_codon:yes stop_codon:yes gene_type:complete